jgi:hypothetical protein
MQWPYVTIQVAFNASRIKSTTGLTYTSITSSVLRWGYRRGRQRQLQKPETGTAYLELDNSSGNFDPENVSSPYYNSSATPTAIGDVLYEGAGLGMRPGRHVWIWATWGGTIYDLFYGFVTRWQPIELEGKREPIVRVEASDLLGWIGRGTQLNVQVSGGLKTGEGIEDMLTDPAVGFDASFVDVDDGTVTVQSMGSTDTNLLTALQSYAETEEPGIFFVDGLGRFVYHDHLRRLSRERSIVRQATFDNSPAAQQAGALPFERVTYTRDDTELYNRVTVTRNGGTPQTAVYSTSYLRHGTRDLSRSTRHTTDADALRLAQQLRNRFTRLQGQHTRLEVNGAANVAELWPKILGLTISDQIRVTERLYPGLSVSTGRTRTFDSFIEGMQVDVEQAAGTGWRAVYQLSPVVSDIYWKIGGKGVAFPGSPSNNDLYYREDLDLLCFYHSSAAVWLTVNEYSADLQPFSAIPPFVNTTVAYLHPVRLDFNYYITRWQARVVVNTTNNGSNYWTVALTRDGTTVASASTASDAAGAVLMKGGFVSAVHGASNYFSMDALKTGAPGTINLNGSFWYRLVVP